MTALTPISTAATTLRPEDITPLTISRVRRGFLLGVFCIAQFVDVYSASAVVLGIPDIAAHLDMSANESTWTINAYVICLASFMLAAGKVSDLWSAKYVFIGGLAWVGIFGLGIGFCEDKVTFFVLRAVKGIGAAACIPSALHLIVHMFPRADDEHFALSVFGASGEVANVAGFILGGVLLLASWEWIFWLLAPVCIPLAVACVFCIPSDKDLKQMHYDTLRFDAESGDKRSVALLAELESLPHPTAFDYVGTFLLLGAMVLTIFGLTDGSEGGGWLRPQPIVTLAIGVILFPLFFWYETRIDPVNALITPAIWKIKNVTPLMLVALTPYAWWYAVQFNYANILAEWGVNSIMTAVHFLPISVGGGAVFLLVIFFPSWPSLKIRMVGGSILACIGSLLLVWGESEGDYWPLVMPGFFLGSLGTALVFITVNNAAMKSSPSQHAGVVGGTLNSTYQLGAAIVLSITASLKANYIEPAPAGDVGGHGVVRWKAYQATFGFLAVLCALTGVLVYFAYEEDVPLPPEPPAVEEAKEAVSSQ